MTDRIAQKEALLRYIERLEKKHQLAGNVPADYFEPGMMEHLDQYLGVFDEESGTATLRIEAKGLRYEDRTALLENVRLGEPVRIEREQTNPYNPNNFTILAGSGGSLGNLPAEFCNVLAPLYDGGYAVIEGAAVSYLEKIRERSRYARQGVLFLEIRLCLRGI